MMNLCELSCGQRARVLSVRAETLIGRLSALGVYPGARLTLLKRSPLGHTYLIASEASRVALAREIAREIEVCSA